MRRVAVLLAAGLLAVALVLVPPPAPAPAVPTHAATTSPVPTPTPSPNGSAPTSSGPDWRFILIGIGCILFAIVIARRGKREGRSNSSWF